MVSNLQPIDNMVEGVGIQIIDFGNQEAILSDMNRDFFVAGYTLMRVLASADIAMECPSTRYTYPSGPAKEIQQKTGLPLFGALLVQSSESVKQVSCGQILSTCASFNTYIRGTSSLATQLGGLFPSNDSIFRLV